MEGNVWAKCGPCKKPIDFGAKYFRCDVSTCRKLAFCSVDCFSRHREVARHKDAWAEEAIAPLTRSETVAVNKVATAIEEEDILIVASKLKAFIKAHGGDINMSATVLPRLSEMVRQSTLKAIDHARRDGRKTVMDRDF